MGIKVPFWGGMSAAGGVALRLWTPTPKMKKEAWVQYVPALKRAASQADAGPNFKRLKMWLDNETFLKADNKYHQNGLTAMRFPPASSDLNPIETLWARLRRDLAIREFEDLKNDKVITTTQFKQRVSQLLTSYACVRPGTRYSYVESLIRGMPKRLMNCKKKNYGPRGK